MALYDTAAFSKGTQAFRFNHTRITKILGRDTDRRLKYAPHSGMFWCWDVPFENLPSTENPEKY